MSMSEVEQSEKRRRIYAVLIGVCKPWAQGNNAKFLDDRYPDIEPMTLTEGADLIEELTTINL